MVLGHLTQFDGKCLQSQQISSAQIVLCVCMFAAGRIPDWTAYLSQASDSPFRRRVYRHERHALESRDARGPNDLPALALLDHLLPRYGIAVEDARDIDVEDPLYVLLGQVEDVVGLAEPGVGDHDLQRAQLRGRCVDEGLYLCALGDVRGDADRFAAGGFDGFYDSVDLGLFARNVVDHHGISIAREAFGNCLA